MAISQEVWDKAKILFETGKLSLSEISERTGIDKSTISKKAKNQQWNNREHSDYIEAKEIIATKKSILNQQEINTLDDIAEQRTKHLIYFNNSVIKNQELNNKRLEVLDKMSKEDEYILIDKDSTKIIDYHALTTAKNKDTLLGKDPETVINNANIQQEVIIEIE